MKNTKIEQNKKYLKEVAWLAKIIPDVKIQEEEVETIENILQYIEKLENKVKELGKGQHTLMQSRRKWKNRYYKEKTENKELKIEVEHLKENVEGYSGLSKQIQEDFNEIVEENL